MKTTKIKLREAAMVCRTNEIKIRRLILSNQLQAERIRQGEKNFVYLIALDALRACPALKVDEALVLALEHHNEDVSELEARVAALERALFGRSESKSIPVPLATPPRAVEPYTPLQTVIHTPQPMGGLPEGCVSLAAYAVRHGVNPGTAKNAAKGGRLLHRYGHWRMYAEGKSTTVDYLLDAEGRRQFMTLFASLGGFRHCDDPLCECRDV